MEEQEQSSTPSQGSKGPILAIVGIIVVVVVAVIGYQTMNKGTSQTSTTPAVTTQPTEQVAEQPTTAVQGAAVKDGTYTAVGNYTSPGGAEELGVTLTIENGIITDSEVEVMATRPISKTRQEDFAANYKEQVVGKSIEDLQLSKVSGSSLSPKGFNDALTQIKAQAEAQS